MKRENVTLEQDWTDSGTLCLQVNKRKGRLSLDDITEACREFGEGFFCYVFKVGGSEPQDAEDSEGDYAEVFPVAERLEVDGDRLV